MEKNLIQNNNGTVDEELLRGFFADSVRMHVADSGFSRRVMQRLPAEASARQLFVYNAWTAVWTVVCIAMFFANDCIGLLKDGWHGICEWLVASLPDISWQAVQTADTWQAFVRHASQGGTILPMAVLIVAVLGSVAWYEVRELR